MYPRPDDKPHKTRILDKLSQSSNAPKCSFPFSTLPAPVQVIHIRPDIMDDLGIVQPYPCLVVVIDPSLGEIGRGHYRLFSVDHIDLSMERPDEKELSSQPSYLILDVIAHS